MLNLKLEILIISIISLCFLHANAQVCTQDQITPVIDPSDLPKLSKEFQTRLVGSFNYGIDNQKATSSLILYDFYDRRAELIINDNEKRIRQIFYYDKNEFFTIGFNMVPPEELLHFNNNFPHMKVETTEWRGIVANHYRSCQYWANIGANFLIDYYFKVPEFKPSVEYDDEFKEIPIGAIIQAEINSKDGRTEKVHIEYNYYEFRSRVQIKEDLFVQPEGIFCNGQTYREPLPIIPNVFSFTEEVIIAQLKEAVTAKIHYSYDLKLIRYDITNIDPKIYRMNAPLKVISDFNSGVGYTIDKLLGNCTSFPIGLQADAISINSNSASGVHMKNPYELFYLNNETYFYAGKRVERGVECDVFVSNVSEFNGMQGLNKPNYWIFEIYFLSIDNVQIGSQQNEVLAPFTTKITSSDGKQRYVNNIYDFDNGPISRNMFDVSSCYTNKEKKLFGIKFNYPENINLDIETFENVFAKDIEQLFDAQLFQLLSMYNFSPVRIIPPKIRALKDGFVVYSGLTNYPAALKQFRKIENQVRIDIDKVVFKEPASSPTDCAELCLSYSRLSSSNFKCLSFDICRREATFVCSFYNSSFISDPTLIVDTEPLCDHYAKNVETFDSLYKEVAFNMIENSVIRGEFNININLVTTNILFAGVDIFPATLDSTVDLSNNLGTTSYFDQFKEAQVGVDFNVDEIKKNKSLSIRQKKGISIIECARLCLTEPAFDCQSLSFESIQGECKWSSLIGAILDYVKDNPYLQMNKGYVWYYKSLLYNFYQFPSQVETQNNLQEIIVKSATECAFRCNTNSNFTCRSFNLCEFGVSGNPQVTEPQFRCFLSENHNHNIDKDPNLQESYLCDHYSRKALQDFQLVPETQLNVKPQSEYLNVTVEICAQMCTYTDAFFCRSFDFFTDTNICFLYKVNLKDKLTTQVTGVTNLVCEHYTRIYLTENGISQTIDPSKLSTSEAKYSGGQIFGIVIGVLIGGLIFGVACSYLAIVLFYTYKKKRTEIPSMKFDNSANTS